MKTTPRGMSLFKMISSKYIFHVPTKKKVSKKKKLQNLQTMTKQ